LSRKLEEFKPLREDRVGVYVCGLTVYDYMHIGHARTYIAFDVILRYLKYRGYNVTYIQNITDIDDKIIRRAKEKNISPMNLSKDYAEKALEDQEKLNITKANGYPMVSDNIKEIISAIQRLIDKGHAYVADGNVYFDVSTFPDYGKLSHQDIEQLKKHRIEPDKRKRTPLDFLLWKESNDDEIGFESPWGYGRPGWHIECSVMSQKYLGDQFDIHGGALDLVFPHHENEIAQSESLTGKKPFVKYWLHTGFLSSSGEKMSKSLGNIISVREFLKKHSKEALRLFLLQTHYRSPVDYSEDNIFSTEKAIERLKKFRRELDIILSKADYDGNYRIQEISYKLRKDFIEYMDDDFNTPKAVASIFDAVRKINSLLTENESKKSIEQTIDIFDELMEILGIEINLSEAELTMEEKKLIDMRNKYRKEKNWVEADKIRRLLLERGIEIIDKNDITLYNKKSK